jgi:hypothetical protein
MAKFFSEWGRLLLTPLRWFKGVSGMLKLLPSAAIPAVLFGVAAMWGSAPWWIVPLTIVIVFYLALTAGMAWERANRESVEMGPLQLDARDSVFFAVVKNTCEERVWPEVWVTRVIDMAGNRRHIGSVESPWRHHAPDYSMCLEVEGAEAEVALFLADSRPSGNPSLCVVDKGKRIQEVTSDLPLSSQETIVFSAVAFCKEWSGKKRATAKCTFSIAPDPGSAVGYKIVPASSRTGWPGRGAVDSTFRWLVERTCTTIERVFGSRGKPPS